jgi:hypothetical protein
VAKEFDLRGRELAGVDGGVANQIIPRRCRIECKSIRRDWVECDVVGQKLDSSFDHLDLH